MRKIIRLMLIGGICVIFVILLKNEYARYLPNSKYGMQAAINEEHISNLFMGSSMFRQGLSIDVLEVELEGESYILSYNGNQPIMIAKQLEYLLENGVTIDNLYVDLYPYTAVDTPSLSDTKILIETNFEYKKELWEILELQGEVSFSDLYEFYVTSNNEILFTYPIYYPLMSTQFRNGGSLSVKSGRSNEELDELSVPEITNEINGYQLEGYNKIIEVCKINKIKLKFIETPKYSKVNNDKSYIDVLNKCVVILENNNVECIVDGDIDFNNENGNNFIDLIHMSTEGSKVYTTELCKIIKSDNFTYNEKDNKKK